MFKTKKDVDRHVRVSLSKLRSDTEKNLRGFTIAKLYFKINEYEATEQHLINFLSVKHDSAPAYKLLGECYVCMKKMEKALSAFQRSLQIDSKQQDLLKSVCKLLTSNDSNLPLNTVKYWCDLAESERVQDNSVFDLKLKLLSKNNSDCEQMEELIAEEIIMNPNAPKFRVQLLKFYLDKQKITEAFEYAYSVEMEHHEAVENSLEWYNTVWSVVQEYKQSSDCKKDWKYWLISINCLERCVFLTLCDDQDDDKTHKLNEAAKLLCNFDKCLMKSSQFVLSLCPTRDLAIEFINHFRGQFCLYAATLLYSREQIQKRNQWRETTRYSIPLLLSAYHISPSDYTEFHLKRVDVHTKQLLQLWNRQGAFRCAQAGRTLLSCIKDKKDLTNQDHMNPEQMLWTSSEDLITQTLKLCRSTNFRTQLYQMLFSNFEQMNQTKTSYLVNCPQLAEPTFEIPSMTDIEYYEETARYLKPQSLQQIVYLCVGCTDFSEIHCKFFEGLPFSTESLVTCGPEFLTQLDMDTFLIAATIQAKRKLQITNSYYEDYIPGNGWKPNFMPFPNLIPHLCSEEQSNWWLAAFNVYKNLPVDSNIELRAILKHGLEAIRCVGGPKIDLTIVLKLGQSFVSRAQDANKMSEKTFLEERADRFYKFGIHMLKLHQKNVLEPFRKLFKYVGGLQRSADDKEIDTLAEEAITYLSAKYFENGEYEECVEQLSEINLPAAKYFQAEAYMKMDESNKLSKKKKKHFAEKAKDCFNQTLNLLSTSTPDSNSNPLASLAQTQIKRLQQSSRLSSEKFTNGFQNDDFMEDSFSARTPVRSRRNTSMSSPNPIEMENLIKQVNSSLSLMKEELTQVIKLEVSSMRRDLFEFKDKLNSIEDNMKKKNIEPANSDDAANVLEDLCRMDDDLQNQNFSAQQPLYLNFNQQSQRIHTPTALQPPVNAYHNSSLYNQNYPLNYYSQYVMPVGAGGVPLQSTGRAPLSINPHVPFIDPNLNFNLPTQQMTIPPVTSDSRSSLMGAVGHQATGGQSMQEKPLAAAGQQQSNTLWTMWNKFYNNAPTEKGPPVNVVITSSDPLPSHTNVTQQSTLSVTIPIQHIKSNQSGVNVQPQQQQQQQLQQQFVVPPSVPSNNFTLNQHGSSFTDVSSSKTTCSIEGSISSVVAAYTCVDNQTKNKTNELDNKKVLENDNISTDFKPISTPSVSDGAENLTKDKNDDSINFHVKVQKFNEKEWIEFGVCVLKFSNNKQDGSKHVLIKTSNQKQLVEFPVKSEMLPVPHGNDGKCYIVNILNATGTQNDSFKIKFKNAQTAKLFYTMYSENLKPDKNVENEKPPTEPTEKKPNEPKLPSFSFNFNKSTSTLVQPNDKPLFANIFSKPDSTTSSNANVQTSIATNSSPFSGLFGTKNLTTDSSTTTTSFFGTNTIVGSDPKPVTMQSPNAKEHTEDDEYVPTAQFQPVIPLPDLVELQTGEENEEVLFEHRAKLLRFDAGEWKERGVGNIKLMVNKDDPNRVRLIMRREAVLKLCCNQRVTKDLKFNKFPNNNAVLSWAGQDYSENELRTELFSIRFKTSDICQKFHEAVIKAQANMDGEITENEDKLTQQNQKTKEEEPVQGFGDKFKPVAGSWNCSACYLSNSAQDKSCVACEQPRYNDEKKVDVPTSTKSNMNENPLGIETQDKGFGDKFKLKTGQWNCKDCYLTNENSTLYCVACESPKDDTVPKKEMGKIFDSSKSKGFTFGFTDSTKSTTGGGFNFGIPAISTAKTEDVPSPFKGFNFGTSKPASDNKNTEVIPAPTVEENKPFGLNFGKPVTPIVGFGLSLTDTARANKESESSLSFNIPKATAIETSNAFNLEKQEFSFVLKPKSPGKSKSPVKKNFGVEEESDNENVEEENNTYFTPVIPLPDKVEVKTGEENEEVLYSHRAKLFRFIDSEWKERGLGDVKILRHKETNKLRVVMRREQVLKICLNHVLNEDVEYKRKDDKSWHFIVNDFSEGEIELMQFCLRFKTADIAQNFLAAVNDAIGGKTAASSEEKEEQVIIDTGNNSQQIQGLNETQTTDDDKSLVDQLHLPLDFYQSDDKEVCTGCIGCNPDEFVFPKYDKEETESENINPLPLVMPKLEKSNNVSLIKQSTFGVGNSTIPQAAPKVEKSIFGTENLFLGSGLDASTNIFTGQPKAPADNNFRLTFGQNANESNSENKQVSGNFIFGNSTSFGNADTTKKNVNQGQTFDALTTFGFHFGSTPLTDQKTSTNDSDSSKFSFSSKENKENAPANEKPTFSFKTPVFSNSNQYIFGNTGTGSTDIQKQNTFASLASSFSAQKESNKIVEEKSSSSEALFKNDPGLSFASLAKDADKTSTFRTTKNTTEFIGLTGDDAFRNFMSPKNKSATEDNNTSQNQGEEDTSHHDPHYDPVIELPDEIVVTTGEEDEEKLFKERAVLYRYDAVNKEWKERGVGDLKLLYHPIQGSYRLVMRREQIHKLVLNHSITDSFNLSPMNKSGKAFCWAAMNYAEEQNGQLESLAARFKNTDLASKFEAEINKCISHLKNRSDLEPEED